MEKNQEDLRIDDQTGYIVKYAKSKDDAWIVSTNNCDGTIKKVPSDPDVNVPEPNLSSIQHASIDVNDIHVESVYLTSLDSEFSTQEPNRLSFMKRQNDENPSGISAIVEISSDILQNLNLGVIKKENLNFTSDWSYEDNCEKQKSVEKNTNETETSIGKRKRRKSETKRRKILRSSDHFDDSRKTCKIEESPEDKISFDGEQRLVGESSKIRKTRICNETPEVRRKRLDSEAARKRDYRMYSETSIERRQRLDREAERRRSKRLKICANESADEKRERLNRESMRRRESRMNQYARETDEQRRERLLKDAVRAREMRFTRSAIESDDDRRRRLIKDADRKRELRMHVQREVDCSAVLNINLIELQEARKFDEFNDDEGRQVNEEGNSPGPYIDN